MIFLACAHKTNCYKMFSVRFQAPFMLCITMIYYLFMCVFAILVFSLLLRINSDIANSPAHLKVFIIKECMLKLHNNNVLFALLLSMSVYDIYLKFASYYHRDYLLDVKDQCLITIFYCILYWLTHKFIYNELMIIALRL